MNESPLPVIVWFRDDLRLSDHEVVILDVDEMSLDVVQAVVALPAFVDDLSGMKPPARRRGR